jgi:hypothetical protein
MKVFWQKKAIIAGGPVLILLLLVLGLRYDLFHSTACYDLFMHVLGGGVSVVSFAGVVWHAWLKKRNPVVSLTMKMKTALVAAVFLVSILWEMGEVILGMTPNWTQSVGDTLSDVFYGVAGATIALCFVRPSTP